jgi:hypothetical protein
MGSFEYTRVIDEIADHFKATEVDYQDFDRSTVRFNVTMIDPRGEKLDFEVVLADYSMLITFDENYQNESEMNRWMSQFEYNLEQTYSRNIGIEVQRSGGTWSVKVEY